MAHHELLGLAPALVGGLERMLDGSSLIKKMATKLDLEIILLERRCLVVGREADKLDLEITLLERQVLERGEDV
jgi:hypothetical protein